MFRFLVLGIFVFTFFKEIAVLALVAVTIGAIATVVA